MRRVLRERLPAAAAGLFLLAWLTLPAAARAQTELFQELKTVQSVRLEGVEHVSRGQLRRVMKTRTPSRWRPWADRQALRLDFLRSDTLAIRSVYRHAGFLGASATYRILPGRNPDRVVVEFHVTEGPRTLIREVRLDNVRPRLAEDIRGRLWARPRRPFDPGFLHLDTLVISAVYQDHGFRPHVAGTATIDRERHEAQVVYDIREGPQYRIGEVLAHGYQPVAQRLVMRELLLEPGDVERRDRVLRSQERLYETGLFSQVQFTAYPESAGATVDYEVRLRARPPRWLEVGVSSSSTEKVKLGASWGYKNLGGAGFQLALGGQLALDEQFDQFKRARVDVGLLEPWLLGVRIRAQVAPFVEWFDDRTPEHHFLRQTFTGVDFHLRRDVNRFTTVRLTQRNVFARQEPVFDDTVLTAPERDSVRAGIARRYRTHSVLLAFERDLRDNFLLTRRGNSTVAVAEVAGGALKGTSSFQKGDVTQSWYTPIGPMVLATRLRGGVISPFGPRAQLAGSSDPRVERVPSADRFRTGGVNSIRGYTENQIPVPPANGGLALVQGNVELRVPLARLPLLGNLGLEAFVDFGNVWARPEYIRMGQFRPSVSRRPYGERDVHYVFGLGPRLELPIGPLRVDLSWSARPSAVRGYLEPRVQFAIGPSI